MKQKNVGNKKTILTIIALAVFAVAIGVAIAYFVDRTNPIDNNVTVGKVDVKLTEPGYDPDDAKAIEPKEEIDKDPTITNTGKNKAYVYIEVKVPKEEVVLVLDDQILSDKQVTELFTYNVNPDWEQIDSTQGENYNTYVYAYTTKVIDPNEQTSPLFNKVKFKNVLEGQLSPTKEYIISVKGYAIQSDTIKAVGDTTKEKMTYIFNNYLKGEGN